MAYDDSPPPSSIHRRHRQRPRAGGFTLVEMMVVLVLIGLLASLVTVNVRHYLVKGKQNAARAEVATICSALETYYATYGRYPSNDEGLAALCQKGEGGEEPLLKQVPTDPWGRPYFYNQPGRTEPYEVVCFGADGKEGGDGADADIRSWDLKDRGGPQDRRQP